MIRPATDRDVSAIAALEASVFGRDAWSSDPVREELLGPGRWAWVEVGDTDEVLGYVVTRTVGEMTDLQRIAVHPDHQRRGLAGTLLAAAVEQARADGADRMLLEVSATNDAALAFYTAAGFDRVDTRPRYYRDGSDAHVLLRRLAAGTGQG